MKILLEYPVRTSFVLTVERDELPDDPWDLLESITRDELVNAQINDIDWGDLKESWRDATPDSTYVYDENHEQLYDDL